MVGLMKPILKIIESRITPYVILSIILFSMNVPIVLMLFNSFKGTQETYAWPPTTIPLHPTLEVYEKVLNSTIPINLRNSFIIAGVTTIIVIAASVFTAYGVSKYKFRGSKHALLFVFATRIIPPLSLLVPFYLIMTWLKLVDTYTGIIIINVYLCYPLVVLMVKGFFDDFPTELIDSALVDGCGRTTAFFRIVLPLSAVGIAAAAIITFLWTWNEFIFAMVFLSSVNVQPMTVGIFQFVGDEVIEWNSLSAVGMFTSLPAIIFFIIAQRYIIEGLTKGAIKF